MEQTQAQTKVENNHAHVAGTDVVGALYFRTTGPLTILANPTHRITFVLKVL